MPHPWPSKLSLASLSMRQVFLTKGRLRKFPCRSFHLQPYQFSSTILGWENLMYSPRRKQQAKSLYFSQEREYLADCNRSSEPSGHLYRVFKSNLITRKNKGKLDHG
jgi:hypothetical protein